MSKVPIPSRLTKVMRSVQRRTITSGTGRLSLQARARMSGRAPQTILLVSDGAEYTSEQQFAPLIRHAGTIARHFGITFRFVRPDVACAMSADQLRGFAAVGIKLSFRTTADEAESIAEALFAPLEGHRTRALVFDGDDDLGVLFHGVIARCDAYIKKHIYADLADYGRQTVGKSNLTDVAHRDHGVNFQDDIIPTSGGLDPKSVGKIVLGWNIALDDKIYDLSRDLGPLQEGARRYDLSCRASVAESVWTHGHRDAAVKAIEALADTYRVHAPKDRVPQAAYYAEMLQSRISVSPFGFGELCWRDFECILCGAVLVKPDMSHLRTAPDLFVPGETCLPVAWNFSDLGSVCAPYLADEAMRREMADKARARLFSALEEAWFLKRFSETMQAAGVTRKL
ncbi:MAG: glycosyltransferase [Sulfitobacter sp.]